MTIRNIQNSGINPYAIYYCFFDCTCAPGCSIFLSAHQRPFIQSPFFGVDTKTYDDFAQTILAGDWLLKSVPIHYMGPLYAYFLAMVYGIFGHHYEAAHAVQYFLGSASAAIIFLAARLWFSNRVAFLAGLIPALSATLIVYEGYLLPESLAFFLVALMLLFTGPARRITLITFFIFGIMLALAPTTLHNRIFGGQWRDDRRAHIQTTLK